MTLEFETKAGLVFGLEADQLFIMDEDEKMHDEPVPVIYLHIGFITLAFIMDQKLKSPKGSLLRGFLVVIVNLKLTIAYLKSMTVYLLFLFIILKATKE